jgi:hypothetical protein
VNPRKAASLAALIEQPRIRTLKICYQEEQKCRQRGKDHDSWAGGIPAPPPEACTAEEVGVVVAATAQRGRPSGRRFSRPQAESRRDYMTRIAIIDRADMNAEQARVYDEAKRSSGISAAPTTAEARPEWRRY